jgi:hypothetical protein
MSTANLLLTPPEQAIVSPAREVALQLKFLPASSRSEALSVWRRLENEFSSRRLTCSSLWTETWLNHFGTQIPHQFVIGHRGGLPRAIALLTEGVGQKAGPVSLHTYHLGTAGEREPDSICVEYNTLLSEPSERGSFAVQLWAWVQQQTRCDELHLDGFEASDIEPFVSANPGTLVDRRPCYFYDLKATCNDGEEPLMRLGTHTRGNIRRTLRELVDARGEWAESASRGEEMFHQLVQLHQARWNSSGHPGVYSSRRFFDFHVDLLHRAIPRGKMGLFRVMAGGRLIGCVQTLIDEQRVLHYQCGRVQATGRVSYGMALDYLCICEALRRGYDAVDFLAGTGEHKRRLSTNRAELCWVTWRRDNLKNRVVESLRRMKHATESIGRLLGLITPKAKQSPADDNTAVKKPT